MFKLIRAVFLGIILFISIAALVKGVGHLFIAWGYLEDANDHELVKLEKKLTQSEKVFLNEISHRTDHVEGLLNEFEKTNSLATLGYFDMDNVTDSQRNQLLVGQLDMMSSHVADAPSEGNEDLEPILNRAKSMENALNEFAAIYRDFVETGDKSRFAEAQDHLFQARSDINLIFYDIVDFLELRGLDIEKLEEEGPL